MLPKVVLYNPRAVFWTMPLAPIAVGSALDRSKFQVVLIDGRLEPDPTAAILRHVDGETLCLGITVLTGAPIRDAVLVSRAVKAKRPSLPIVWGGWHPSLFPGQCLTEPSVDFVVVGQGEITFAELVDRLANRTATDGLHGCMFRREGQRTSNLTARPFMDINLFPAHNYDLIDVERYFRSKGRRQLDYISSQGCRFRCAFCADPTVYRRGWSGFTPDRVAAELDALHRAHRYDEIAFQDETFFTSPDRVRGIAEALLKRGLALDWTATMRSDQGSRLDDDLLSLCKRAGLKRVMIGVESGSPVTLQRIRKDISLDQIFDSASKCARHGIGAILNFIVGFPDESEESIRQTLNVAARLRRMSAAFEISIFYFRPYPGTPIADFLGETGYHFPSSLDAWADFDYVGGRGSWVTEEQWKQIERFKFYQRYAYGPARRGILRPLQIVSRWRVDRSIYSFPVEKITLEKLRPAQKLS